MPAAKPTRVFLLVAYAAATLTALGGSFSHFWKNAQLLKQERKQTNIVLEPVQEPAAVPAANEEQSGS